MFTPHFQDSVAHHKLEEHCNHWVGHPKHWTTLHHSSFQATHPDDARAAEAAILYGSGARGQGPGARARFRKYLMNLMAQVVEV